MQLVTPIPRIPLLLQASQVFRLDQRQEQRNLDQGMRHPTMAFIEIPHSHPQHTFRLGRVWLQLMSHSKLLQQKHHQSRLSLQSLLGLYGQMTILVVEVVVVEEDVLGP